MYSRTHTPEILSSRSSVINLRPNFLSVKIPTAKINDEAEDGDDQEEDEEEEELKQITFKAKKRMKQIKKLPKREVFSSRINSPRQKIDLNNRFNLLQMNLQRIYWSILNHHKVTRKVVNPKPKILLSTMMK